MADPRAEELRRKLAENRTVAEHLPRMKHPPIRRYPTRPTCLWRGSVSTSRDVWPLTRCSGPAPNRRPDRHTSVVVEKSDRAEADLPESHGLGIEIPRVDPVARDDLRIHVVGESRLEQP